MQAPNIKKPQTSMNQIPHIPASLPYGSNPFGKNRNSKKNKTMRSQNKIALNSENLNTQNDKQGQNEYLNTENVEVMVTQEQDDERTKFKKSQTLNDVIEDQDEVAKGGFEDGRKTKAYYARFLLIDQAVSSFSFLSIIIAVLEYDLEFEEREEFIAQSMLWMTFILTIGMIFLTVLRFQAKLEWFKTRKVVSEKANLITSGLLKYLIGEILISAIHPMPWTWNIRVEFFNEPQQKNGYYHLNEILLLIMLLRALLIARTLLMMSEWYNNRTQRVCAMYACQADFLFVIKCIMGTKPYTLISSAMVVSIFYFGFAIRICEAPLMRFFDDGKKYFYSFWNCMWNIIVTMTTVGYGDYFAQTQLGRFIIFFVCIWGVFIISMMVITLTKQLEITVLESKAIAVLERIDLKEQMRAHAAMVLTLLARICLEKNKKTNTGFDMKKYQINLRRYLNEFKKATRQYRSISDENPGEELHYIKSLFQKIQKGRQFGLLREDITDIFQKQNHLLETNIQLMSYMKMDKQQIDYYTKNFTRSTFQQLPKFDDDSTDKVRVKASKHLNVTPNVHQRKSIDNIDEKSQEQ